MIYDFVLRRLSLEKFDKNASLSDEYSDVYDGIYHGSDGDMNVTISSPKNSIKEEDDYRARYRQLCVLSSIDHPCLTKFIGFVPPIEGDLRIVFKYQPNGVLHRLLELNISKNAPIWYNGTFKTCCAYGIAVGLEYLHSQRIVHRNICTKNILIDENKHPIISGFELATHIKNEKLLNENIKITPYSAPEIIKCANYGFPLDVYAYGVLLYQIYNNISNLEDIKPISQEDLDCLNDGTDMIFLIQACLSPDPNERPTFRQIVDQFAYNRKLYFAGCNQEQFDDFITEIPLIREIVEKKEEEKEPKEQEEIINPEPISLVVNKGQIMFKNCPNCDLPAYQENVLNPVICPECQCIWCFQCLKAFSNLNVFYQHIKDYHQ